MGSSDCAEINNIGFRNNIQENKIISQSINKILFVPEYEILYLLTAIDN
jgi:hypothetical protein